MTPKRERILWMIYGLVLVVLFLVSSTNMVIKEKETQVYPISVIVNDSSDDYYVNLKKGIEQAAMDYHADVSFITLYERNRQDQQIDLITREVNDGARAVIISPVEEGAIAKALDENLINSSVVILDSELSHNKISANISGDFYGEGVMLADKVVERMPAVIPIYIVMGENGLSSNTMAYDGLRSVLDKMGYQVELYEADTDQDYRKIVEGLVYPEYKEAVIIAIDLESLTKIAQILDESAVYRKYTPGVYGFGSTLQILNYLDEEIIDGIVVTNDFLKGYLSIQKAVEGIQNTGTAESIKTEHFYIEKEDIRKKEYQKLLYPID